MAFFRKWKINYKHKKLSEDWGLGVSGSNLKESSPEICKDENESESEVSTMSTYDNIKYVGSTTITGRRSQKLTSEAIKSVISNSKVVRGKKNQQRVKLNISADGIEVLDSKTDEIVLKVSIYKISYCSVDAAHADVFSFVASEKDMETDIESSSCYVFLCPKRRIAHEITLTVAMCFEHAYQNWRTAVDRQAAKESIRNAKNDKSNLTNRVDSISSSATTHEKINESKNESSNDLLIDFTPDTSMKTDVLLRDSREYLQNTWVSFDEEPRENRQMLVC